MGYGRLGSGPVCKTLDTTWGMADLISRLLDDMYLGLTTLRGIEKITREDGPPPDNQCG